MRTRIIAALLATAALAACGSASEPAVGTCTNADPNLGVELDVQVVDCDDSTATTRVVKEAADRTECDAGTLQYGVQTFCTEPLRG